MLFESRLEQFVGQAVNVSLSNRSEESGVVYAADRMLNLLVLQQAPESKLLPHQAPRFTYKILPVAAIKSINQAQGMDGLSQQTANVELSTKPLNLEKFQARERNSLRERHLLFSKTNNKASEIGQKVFDALSRTLPCVWQGQAISVLSGEVVVADPYTVSAVTGRDSSAVERVRKVLQLERQRLSIQ